MAVKAHELPAAPVMMSYVLSISRPVLAPTESASEAETR